MTRAAPRIPQVEGLRAVAAGAVFLTHLGQKSTFTSENALGPLVARMNVGVTIFFVITGYLLYRPWAAARLNGTPAPDARRYAVRRAARILPAYWVALIILGLLLPDFVRNVFTSEGWASFTLLQVYSYDWIFNGLIVAWSLGTEVAFYVVLPALAYAVMRLIGRRAPDRQVRIELAALAVSSVVAIGLLEVAHHAGWGPTYPNTLLGKWPWFAVGMALAVASAAWGADEYARAPRLVRSAVTRPWLWWIAAGAVLLFSSLESVLPREVFAMDYRDVMLETVLFTFFAAVFVTPVVVGQASMRRSPARLLSSGAMTWLGTVSYGIFLWHLPIIDWSIDLVPQASVLVLGLVSSAITVLCAAASWYLIERPSIGWARRRHAGDATPRGAIVAAMAEQNPTPPTVCVVCGEFITDNDGVAVPEYHEGGEILATLMRHNGCAMPAGDA